MLETICDEHSVMGIWDAPYPTGLLVLISSLIHFKQQRMSCNRWFCSVLTAPEPQTCLFFLASPGKLLRCLGGEAEHAASKAMKCLSSLLWGPGRNAQLWMSNSTQQRLCPFHHVSILIYMLEDFVIWAQVNEAWCLRAALGTVLHCWLAEGRLSHSF